MAGQSLGIGVGPQAFVCPKSGVIMVPPVEFKRPAKRDYSYSKCIACDKWKLHTAIFHHEGRHWILCLGDWLDYWENIDELLSDFKEY